MLYEALGVIAGLFFEFTSVKMKGPNKQIKPYTWFYRYYVQAYCKSLVRNFLTETWLRSKLCRFN